MGADGKLLVNRVGKPIRFPPVCNVFGIGSDFPHKVNGGLECSGNSHFLFFCFFHGFIFLQIFSKILKLGVTGE